ncbi:hypothetical protein [Vibrio algivorus]|uniref:3-phosphoshikimate 1-carboxyvinyltransferase n=1 Tax=Vibrio algivorus TaxID=1667024 RepID=A0ABQ6ELA4_9VIBR|nr:hypothetical protein [Vibrio algivorus]GLT13395.1 hypothetical protein GCM10007931_03690 [Vibrio algivorus]
MEQKYTEEQRQVISRVMRAIPQEVLDSFDSKQRDAIEMAVAVNNVRNDHYVDFRPVIGVGRWRYYAVFLLGKDRRKTSSRSSTLSMVLKSLFILASVFVLFSFAVLVMYLIKSALGIDIFQHFSFGVWDYFQSHFN